MAHNKLCGKHTWVRQFPQKTFSIILLVLALLILAGSGFAHGGNAKYIILFIGDGWGAKHIEAVNKYTGTTPSYQSDPQWVKHWVSTFPAGGSYDTAQAWSDFNYVNTKADTQDSACTASAIYSGSKTSPPRVSVSSDGLIRLFSIGERAKALGKAVGSITTVPVSHATPGAWVAHNDYRVNTFAIADEGFFGDPNTTGTIATNTKYGGGHGPTLPPADVHIGSGGTNYISSQILNKLRTESGQAGKHVLVERQTGVDGGDALMSAANNTSTLKLAGLFDQVFHNANDSGHNFENPTLPESILAAVKVLDRNPNGFVLMVEGGAIDWASHANNMDQMIGEAKDFYNAIQTVTDWVDDPGNDATWNNTLVIVTADHETGYLTAGPGVFPDQPLGNVNAATLSKEKIVSNTGGLKASWEDTNTNNLIEAGETVYWYWNSRGHTNTLVALCARGTGAELFGNYAIHSDAVRGLYLDNTNIFTVMNSAIMVLDTTPPVVSVTSPVSNATGVSVNTAITATFGEAMNAATVTDTTFTISGVAGTVSCSGTTAVFTPSSPLAYSTRYTATITKGVKDMAGNAMAANYSWSFTTTGEDMQVHYRFDEGSGTTAADSSGNGSNGTLFNAPAWTTGKINKALSFDGVNDYVSISNESGFDFERTDSFSASAWVKLAPVSGSSYMIISKLDVPPTYRGWAFFIDGSSGSLRVHLTNNWGTSAYIRKGSALSVTDNLWHHVAFTYNGSSLASGINFYVDGVLSNGVTFKNNLSATILNNITPTLATYTTGASWLKGAIDEVRVYNRALSAQEVLTLFKEATTPDTTPPVVITTSPVNGATGVSVNTVITATFNEVMDTGSISPITFSVSDKFSNVVSGTVSYSGTTATFMPFSPLAKATTYTAMITTGVRDVAGNAMAANYSWSFTTTGEDMQVHYRFDEGSGTTAADSSGNGNNGTLFNAPVWTTGKINKALSFDGVNDYVSISNESGFDFERTDSFSASAWVKLAPVSGSSYMIISKLDVPPTYRGWAFFVDGSSGSLRVHLTNNWGTSAYIRKGSALSVTDNLWHHVAFTYNGSSLASGINFYVDGVLSNGVTFKNNLSATILNNITPTLATYTTGASWLKGTIDEVRVYHRVLSAQEVLALFNQ